MDESLDMLEVRQTRDMGRGVFARKRIARGTCLVKCRGSLTPAHLVTEDRPALQIGPDLWLCSSGVHLDDCINHSCDPNAGFLSGEPVLFALRDIGAEEQVTWDYSTSIAEPGWTLDCLCGSPACRGVVRSWGELPEQDRDRLRPFAMAYLRLDS